ncbi:MAG TPA: DUF2950 domain-containing protein [Burkholderiales bacterium]|nr:DUF2950 domain-containing protein [Burkholderiales bacterium]
MRRLIARMLGLSLAIALAVSHALAATASQKTFASPEAAAAALVEALSTGDTRGADAILGPAGRKLLHSGDRVADENGLRRFLAAYAARHRLVQESDAKAVLHVGDEDWPLPIPIVRAHGAWRFDTAAAAAEILDRRIGKNELNAIQVCLAIVDAQREYASIDHDGSGVLAYARRLVSTPGKKDGLYWPVASGEPPSPLGPLVARAAEEGYGGAGTAHRRTPYHGYFYRILSAQGSHAKGGARSYLVDGKMLGGFGLVAFPARYGASGIMTFIVDQDGAVYQKNLGAATVQLARKMRSFDPDATWRRVPSADEVGLAGRAHAAGDDDRKMLELARDRGCLLCHAFQAERGAVQAISPPAPSFVQIAKRYEGVQGAEDRLTETVLEGTGPRPADHHWKDKVSSDGMLPNTVEIAPDEARSLVLWILALHR